MTQILLPPFDQDTAIAKTQVAEDVWNAKNPDKVVLAYTEDTEWRNRDQFLNGREEIHAFLTAKWEKELDYKLKKEMWAFTDNRIAVRFRYEWHDRSGQWWRSHGNEMWEFAPNGLMQRRYASINDEKISLSEREL